MKIDATTLVRPGESIPGARITISNGSITSIDESESSPADLACAFAVPGFVDVHTHGRIGYDVADASNEALAAIASSHLESGTVAFLASLVTSPIDRIEQVLSLIESRRDANVAAKEAGKEARLVAAHLEGPWISTQNRGAHDPAHITTADREAFELLDRFAESIGMVTIDYHPETAAPLLDRLVAIDAVPALGHDTTLDTEAREAFARGVSHLTHAFSCSSSFQRRHGRKHLGSLEMALITPGVTVEVIADDRHTTRYFWEFITALKPIDEIVVVSDSTRAAGIPERPGAVYEVGGQRFVVEDRVAWLPDRSAFAGSVASMHDCFKTLVRTWGVPIENAVTVTTANPARVAGISGWDRLLAPGSPADLLLLDDNLELTGVVASGRLVR